MSAVDVLMVGVGYMGLRYVDAARDLGLRLCVVDVPERLAFLREQHADVVIDTEAVEPGVAACDESWVGPAMAAARRHRIRGVLGLSEPQVMAAAMTAHVLGLPGVGLYAGQIARNKALQRQIFAGAGVPQPRQRLVATLDALDPRDVELPVVIKPLASAGSVGVEEIAGAAEWSAAVDRRRNEGPLLVEERVFGQEYSWEALVRDGEVVFHSLTYKETTGSPNFVELLHVPGAWDAPDDVRETAFRVGSQVVAALHCGSGIVHLEFRMRPDGTPSVMEVALRTPGDFIMEVNSLAHEVDLYAAALTIAIGERPDVPPVAFPIVG